MSILNLKQDIDKGAALINQMKAGYHRADEDRVSVHRSWLEELEQLFHSITHHAAVVAGQDGAGTVTPVEGAVDLTPAAGGAGQEPLEPAASLQKTDEDAAKASGESAGTTGEGAGQALDPAASAGTAQAAESTSQAAPEAEAEQAAAEKQPVDQGAPGEAGDAQKAE
jgi:hypothetical protein